eukprot:NODE_417_length_2276_cov_29.019758_g383_i0.p1 GENE.NODE_417_length_2276_cov_29.019758_g383_i0~~NODE_417_length_2276_cov_29.019758_g383_i0.p1  ORF type:complete len:575 (+),score=65.74 NODE_417_length_2276_cov_29.019758_g383_i0:295-2019(+)
MGASCCRSIYSDPGEPPDRDGFDTFAGYDPNSVLSISEQGLADFSYFRELPASGSFDSDEVDYHVFYPWLSGGGGGGGGGAVSLKDEVAAVLAYRSPAAIPHPSPNLTPRQSGSATPEEVPTPLATASSQHRWTVSTIAPTSPQLHRSSTPVPSPSLTPSPSHVTAAMSRPHPSRSEPGLALHLPAYVSWSQCQGVSPVKPASTNRDASLSSDSGDPAYRAKWQQDDREVETRLIFQSIPDENLDHPNQQRSRRSSTSSTAAATPGASLSPRSDVEGISGVNQVPASKLSPRDTDASRAYEYKMLVQAQPRIARKSENGKAQRKDRQPVLPNLSCPKTWHRVEEAFFAPQPEFPQYSSHGKLSSRPFSRSLGNNRPHRIMPSPEVSPRKSPDVAVACEGKPPRRVSIVEAFNTVQSAPPSSYGASPKSEGSPQAHLELEEPPHIHFEAPTPRPSRPPLWPPHHEHWKEPVQTSEVNVDGEEDALIDRGMSSQSLELYDTAHGASVLSSNSSGSSRPPIVPPLNLAEVVPEIEECGHWLSNVPMLEQKITLRSKSPKLRLALEQQDEEDEEDEED